LSLQSITDLIVHTKTVTSQGPVFTESFEQRTENPHVGNSVIAPVNMHPEGFDLIEAFLCLKVLVGGLIPVFFPVADVDFTLQVWCFSVPIKCSIRTAISG
jgi:hypothetical protein